jgi:hypothetical protein
LSFQIGDSADPLYIGVKTDTRRVELVYWNSRKVLPKLGRNVIVMFDDVFDPYG